MAKAEKFSVVGKRVQRVEGFDKVTGDSKFIADVDLPGMLIGRILRSPYPHARIRSIDTSKAEKLRGVRAVVTAEDTIKRPWGAFFADQYILSVGKTRYVGEEVAAVAAIDPDIAEGSAGFDRCRLGAAARRVRCRRSDARRRAARARRQAATTSPCIWISSAATSRKPSPIPTSSSKIPSPSMPQWHCAIETIGSVAEYAPNGKYTIYMNTQTLFNARYRIATALGVPETDVRIIQSAVGGGFGGKSCDDNNALVCRGIGAQSRQTGEAHQHAAKKSSSPAAGRGCS